MKNEGYNVLSFENNTNDNEKVSKEEIFDVLIKDEIISAFSDDLESSGFTTEQVMKFEMVISDFDEESIKGILSTPRELRLRNFPKYFDDINSGKRTIVDIVQAISNNARKNGYTLGYHATNNQIIPNGEQWVIDGKELDDRDDRLMAYYSLDYDHIFRADRRKFLYIVRVNIGPNTEHKRDTSNNWGRASTLSIIHEVNLQDIDAEIESLIKQQKRDAA